jgi:dual specificity MAP kinase phosphatase
MTKPVRIADQNLISSLPSPSSSHSSPSAILSFLFLGDESDAADVLRLKRLGITHILNVTAHLQSGSGETGPGFKYKRLPVTDSCRQNLLPYLDEAFQFIGKLMGTWEELEE